jgi:hypothetical protein
MLLSLLLASPTTSEYQLFGTSGCKLMISAEPQVHRSSLISAPSPSEPIWQKGHVNKIKVSKAGTSAKGKRGFVPPAPKGQCPAALENIRTVLPLAPAGIATPAVRPAPQPDYRFS